MKAERIQTSIHYPPIHTFTHYRENYQVVKVGLDNTENVAAREVTLPLYAGMGEEKVELVVRTVQQALQVVRAG
jgi:dTDP-4-amino-4,6-dideoxygalactose transaminase